MHFQYLFHLLCVPSRKARDGGDRDWEKQGAFGKCEDAKEMRQGLQVLPSKWARAYLLGYTQQDSMRPEPLGRCHVESDTACVLAINAWSVFHAG